MNHIVIGAAIPFIVSAVLYVRAGYRASLRMLVLAPLSMMVLGGWAVAPDIPRMLHMRGLYLRLHASRKIDVFFGHYSIDQVEGNTAIYAVPFVVMGACLLCAAWRELARVERG